MKSIRIKMAAEPGCFADSQWLVERARQSLKENNPFEAKTWLITAKTLYPKDFGVQVKQGFLHMTNKNLVSSDLLEVIK